MDPGFSHEQLTGALLDRLTHRSTILEFLGESFRFRERMLKQAASDEPTLENLHPQVALLSVAADDRDGRPDRETLDALGGYSLLRTDLHGWIEISTDGREMWVEVEK